MSRQASCRAGVLLLALAALGSSGCTIIGAGVGAIADSAAKKRLPPENIASVQAGRTRVTLRLKDGTEIRGRIVEFERAPQSEYAKQYARAQNQELQGGLLPSLGDRISVVQRVMDHREGLAGEFLGVDSACLLLRREPDSEPEAVLFSKILSLSVADVAVIDVQRMALLASQGKLPRVYRAVLLRRSGQDVVEVSIDQIDQISVNSSKGLVSGILLGIAGDAILLSTLSSFRSY